MGAWPSIDKKQLDALTQIAATLVRIEKLLQGGEVARLAQRVDLIEKFLAQDSTTFEEMLESLGSAKG